MAKQNGSGEYVSAHVTQATAKYNQLMQSNTPVQGYRQQGDTVYFQTAQPAPLPKRRRSRWWMWIVGAVVAFFVVAALLKAGILAASVGASMAGVILFGVLGFIVWKVVMLPSVGFVGTMIGGLVCTMMLIGAVTSVEPLWDEESTAQQSSIMAECGGIGGTDVKCRWDSLVDSTEKLAEVAQSPASDGLGWVILGTLVVMFGGGYLYWRSQGLHKP